jgi:hypothetical protein
MPVGHVRLITFAAVSIAAGLAPGPACFAQAQNQPPTVRDYCIKVASGKATEYAAFLHDVSVPFARARADAGEIDWFVAGRGVVPIGSSARCDYRVVYGYRGLPPEDLSTEAIEAALKRAKLNMTADQMIARRSSLTQLVGLDIWYQIDAIGPQAEKDSYVRLNHYNVKGGEMDEWIRQEKANWKALMEAWLKAGGKGSWSLNGLGMPGGESTPYNAMTVDFFPDWNSLWRGVPVDELWPKVHPEMTPSEAFNREDRIRSFHDIEYYKLVEVVRAK